MITGYSVASVAGRAGPALVENATQLSSAQLISAQLTLHLRE
jgi:hypothetical protein